MTARDTVHANGADLAVRVDGDPGKPWLLVSNSLATDAGMWDGQMPLLTRTHRVVRYDTRGHGASSAPAGPYDFDMLVADMVAVLDHIGAETVDVLALSMGGMTALGLALDHPERVRTMVVAGARADNPPPFVQGWDQRIAAVREKGMQGVLAGTLERWFTEQTRTGKPEIAKRAGEMILATPVEGYIASAQALQGLDYLRRLPELKLPVLFIAGSEDMGAPQAAMRAMAEATPGSRFVLLPGVAHVMNMEDAAAFNAAIEDWLREAAGRAA